MKILRHPFDSRYSSLTLVTVITWCRVRARVGRTAGTTATCRAPPPRCWTRATCRPANSTTNTSNTSNSRPTAAGASSARCSLGTWLLEVMEATEATCLPGVTAATWSRSGTSAAPAPGCCRLSTPGTAGSHPSRGASNQNQWYYGGMGHSRASVSCGRWESW